MMASIRNTFPIKTSEDFGKLYVPTAEPENPQPQYQNTETQTQNRVSAIPRQPGAAISAPLNYVDNDFDQRFGDPVNIQAISSQANHSTSEPLVAHSAQYSQQTSSSNAKSLYSYNIPVHSGNNTTVRTVVSR
jgi:hypothetical protein